MIRNAVKDGCLDLNGDIQLSSNARLRHRTFCTTQVFQRYEDHTGRVGYSANASSWMTSELFKICLTQFDRRMKAEKRSVLLTLDNCTAHEKFQPQLKATELLFLPPNSTSKINLLTKGLCRILRYTTGVQTSCNWLHVLMLASQGRTFPSTFCRP